MATFDERARDWDTPEHIERSVAVAAAVRAAVPIDRATRVIEIGAGTGLLGLQLAREVAWLTLTDVSTGMLEVAEEKVRRDGLDNVTVRRFDPLADPPPGRFDLVLSLLMLHHLGDTAAALRAIFEMLAPGGRVALADLDTEDGSFHDADAEGIHHHGFDRAELARMAVAAGFVEPVAATATQIEREGRRYPLFLLVARRPDAGDAADSGTA